MFSDIVCEQLIKRKIGPKQIFLGAVIAVIGLLLSWFLWAIGVVIDPTVRLMGILLFACGIALTVFCLRFVLLVEYEYSFVNGELTIDKILAKSKRKHLRDIKVNTFEKLGKYDSEIVGKLKADKVYDYSVDKYDSDSIYAYFKDEGSGCKTLLIFTPNQKLIDSMKTYVNATVYREAFSVAKKKVI